MAKNATFPESALGDLFCSINQSARSPSGPKQIKPSGGQLSNSVQARAGETRYLTIRDVAARYKVGSSTIWRWVEQNPNFPKPFKVSSGTTRWSEQQLVDFEAKFVPQQPITIATNKPKRTRGKAS